MTDLNIGVTGAKRQSFRKTNPRDLLLRMINRNPRTSEAGLREMFADSVRNDSDYIESIIEYWFANNYRCLMQSPMSELAKAERNIRVANAKRSIKSAATKMVLMNMTLPSGKTLRESTAAECARVGGWLSTLAKSMNPAQKVGDVYTEQQVRKFFA